jgi:histidyl-tRNA synthetase
MVEAELCAAVSEVLTDLGFSDFKIRVNHRQLLTSLLNMVGIAEPLHASALVAVDKLDKIGRDGVIAELAQRGVAETSALQLLDIIARPSDAGPIGIVADEAGRRAWDNLTSFLVLTNGTAAEGHIEPDLTLARGLSYYTGAIMEINVPDLAGSLGGGGRYDNLVGMFLGQSVPACGFSLGLERILVVMGERGMFPAFLATTPADVMVAVFDAKDMPHAMQVGASLRKSGLRVLVYPDADKIGKQIKYADSRGIPFVAILGSDEVANGTLTVKHLAAKTQHTYEQGSAGAEILKELKQRG